jgi:hypothetical protein
MCAYVRDTFYLNGMVATVIVGLRHEHSECSPSWFGSMDSRFAVRRLGSSCHGVREHTMTWGDNLASPLTSRAVSPRVNSRDRSVASRPAICRYFVRGPAESDPDRQGPAGSHNHRAVLPMPRSATTYASIAGARRHDRRHRVPCGNDLQHEMLPPHAKCHRRRRNSCRRSPKAVQDNQRHR